MAIVNMFPHLSVQPADSGVLKNISVTNAKKVIGGTAYCEYIKFYVSSDGPVLITAHCLTASITLTLYKGDKILGAEKVTVGSVTDSNGYRYYDTTLNLTAGTYWIMVTQGAKNNFSFDFKIEGTLGVPSINTSTFDIDFGSTITETVIGRAVDTANAWSVTGFSYSEKAQYFKLQVNSLSEVVIEAKVPGTYCAVLQTEEQFITGYLWKYSIPANSPITKNMQGNYILEVYRGGDTSGTLDVTVTPIRKLSYIEVRTLPNKRTYLTTENMDYTGMVVEGFFEGGLIEQITPTSKTQPLFTTVGTKTITIEYRENGITATDTFTVEVVNAPLKVNSIAVTKLPTKTIYAVGETLDTTGMVVTATMEDNSTQAVTPSEVSEPDTSTVSASRPVTVTYSGKTAQFNITVIANPLTLESIAITQMPADLNYYEGDTLNTAGLIVTATMSDASTKNVTSGVTFDYSTGMIGTEEVIIKYRENGITKTTSYNITVERKEEVVIPPGDGEISGEVANFSLKVAGTERINDVEKIQIIAETKGGESIVSANRATIEMYTGRAYPIELSGLVKIYTDGNLLFTGDNVKKTKTWKNLRDEIKYTVFDKLKDTKDVEFAEDTVLTNVTVSNVIMQLTGMLGLTVDYYYDFLDYNVTYVKFETGKKIIDELKACLEAINGMLFCNNGNKLICMSKISRFNLGFSGVYFGSGDINGEIEESIQEKKNNRIIIKFDEYKLLGSQVVFTNKDDVKISGTAGENTSNLTFPYNYALVIGATVTGFVVEDSAKVKLIDTKENVTNAQITYTFTLDETGGKLNVTNNTGGVIFITLIEITGEPYSKLASEYHYAASETDINAKSITSKYVQTKDFARALAESYYKEECNDVKMYKFKSRVVSGVDLAQIVNVRNDAIGFSSKSLIVDKMTHSIMPELKSETEITAFEAKDFVLPSSPYIKYVEKIEGGESKSIGSTETTGTSTVGVVETITEMVVAPGQTIEAQTLVEMTSTGVRAASHPIGKRLKVSNYGMSSNEIKTLSDNLLIQWVNSRGFHIYAVDGDLTTLKCFAPYDIGSLGLSPGMFEVIAPDKVLMIYRINVSGSYHIRLCWVDIITTIVDGIPEYSINYTTTVLTTGGDGGYGGESNHKIYKINDTQMVMKYQLQQPTNTYVYQLAIFTIDWSTKTFSMGTSLPTVLGNVQVCVIRNGSKLIEIGKDSTRSNYTYGFLYNITGDVITKISEALYYSNASYNYPQLAKINEQDVCWVIKTNTNTWVFGNVLRISGETMPSGYTYITLTTVNYTHVSLVTTPVDATNSVAIVVFGSESSNNLICKIKIANTTPTLKWSATNPNYNDNAYRVSYTVSAKVNNNKIVMAGYNCYFDPSTERGDLRIISTDKDFMYPSNVIGVSKNKKNGGELIKVSYGYEVDGFTDLVQGQYYYLGAYGELLKFQPFTGINIVPIALALSATKIKFLGTLITTTT